MLNFLITLITLSSFACFAYAAYLIYAQNKSFNADKLLKRVYKKNQIVNVGSINEDIDKKLEELEKLWR